MKFVNFGKETVTSTQQINEITGQVQKVTQQMGGSIERIATIGDEQAHSIQQISALIENIEELSIKLREFANKL